MKIGTFINHGTIIEIESIQTMNLSVDKGQVCVDGKSLQDFIDKHAEGTPPPVPAELQTSEAIRLHDKLTDAGLLDKDWQPVGLSNAEKGLLVSWLTDKLGIGNQWRVFASLWGMKPENLRSAYNKALEQNKSLAFQDKLKILLG